jgi:hypothetical protein
LGSYLPEVGITQLPFSGLRRAQVLILALHNNRSPQ